MSITFRTLFIYRESYRFHPTLYFGGPYGSPFIYTIKNYGGLCKCEICEEKQKSEDAGGFGMLLYLKGIISSKDAVVDYIEVRLNTGEQVSLNWKTSDTTCFSGEIEGNYSGVCAGELDERTFTLDELVEMQVISVGLYDRVSDTENVKITIEELTFFDGNGGELTFEYPFTNYLEGVDDSTLKKVRDFLDGWKDHYGLNIVEYISNGSEVCGSLFDVAYDLKTDVEESSLNPFANDKGSDDYAAMFDDWYDEYIELIIIPTLCQILGEKKQKVGAANG